MTTTAAASIPFVPRTKLRPPRLSEDLLRRPRLIEKLERPQTLSLVIAPAGYGKTTLISTWLAQCGVPYAWLSLEREDDTLLAFMAGFGAALQRVVPALGSELLNLLQGHTGELAPEQMLPILLNSLNELEERFVVVLDDYHHVSNPAVRQLIGGLLEHPPRALQLVLTARYDPALPPRLRNRGNVTEIRAHELCFTEQEAQAFLGQFVAEPIAVEAVAGIVKKSEGWAVALRLAAMLIGQRQDAAVLDRTLQICERSLLDYMDAEVIGHLPGDVQTFLVRTSNLKQLNATLCDAVLDAVPGEAQQASDRDGKWGIDSKATLRMLASNGIFVEQIDEAGDWFRCHELFRHLLQRRLHSTHRAEEIEALNQCSALWHAQHDGSETGFEGTAAKGTAQGEALRGAVAGGDTLWMVPPAAAESRVPQRTQSVPTTGQQASVLLTYREMDVLTLLCDRLTNKEIAYKLGVSPETVRQHTVNLYRKLGVIGRRQAIVRAQALGLPVQPASGGQVVPQGGRAGGSVPARAGR
ncbi:MAG: LuxR C-terminal-related transcriptional regulator [Caldilineaceae bacterium]